MTRVSISLGQMNVKHGRVAANLRIAEGLIAEAARRQSQLVVLALTICYDLRFPELYRHYATERGAKMMIVCAEWPLMRLAHWRALLIARAIENQCFVVAVNACGETGGTVFAGHSMILDPWGKVAAEAGEGEQLLTVGIDLDEVERVRRTIPVFEDRRPDMYASRDFARREEPS